LSARTAAALDTTRVAAQAEACSRCALERECFLARLLPEQLNDCTGVVQRRYFAANGSWLFHRDAPFSSLYLVCEGAVKTQRVTKDGGMIVTGFYLTGDLVGLDAIGDTRHPCDAITIADSVVCRLDFERLVAFCFSRPAIHSWIISLIGRQLRQKDADHSWTKALQTDNRVLRFFLDLHERLVAVNRASGGSIALPMKKQDIARYLHISPETLSRTLAKLRKDGLLKIEHDLFALPEPERARQATQL
jgi:CRP/FNR family transcriptional regulator